MADYGFNVEIEAGTAQFLSQHGYVLAVQKSTAGTTNSVQWITFKVYATAISVKWTTEYGVYFTITTIDKGAVIQQTSKADAFLGRAYEYRNTKFKDIGPAASDSVSIKSEVDIPASFGLSQLAYDATGKSLLSPVAVAKNVVQFGNVTFSPTEKITVYFNSQYTQGGTVVDVSGESLARTLTPGVTQNYYYDGKWTVRPGAKLALAPEIDPALPFFAFDVVLAGYLPLYAVTDFFKALLPGHKVTVNGGILPGRNYVLSVYGPNPWPKLEAAVGQEIDNIVKEAISAGYYELSGRGAVIDAIIPILTPVSVLWNAVFKHAGK